MLEHMKQKLSITISQALQIVGPMPDDSEDRCRSILKGDDEAAIAALGCYLEECIETKTYHRLLKGLEEIAFGQARHRSEMVRSEANKEFDSDDDIVVLGAGAIIEEISLSDFGDSDSSSSSDSSPDTGSFDGGGGESGGGGSSDAW